MTAIADPLEKVIRPIVEGQIRGFLYEHPAVVNAVDWFKPGTDKASIFTNSLTKRIVLDLLCDDTRNRMKSAVALYPAADDVDAGMCSGITSLSVRGRPSAAEAASLALRSGEAVPSASLLPQIGWGQ